MTSAQVKPVPDGMHTLTPHLVCDAVLAQAVSDMSWGDRHGQREDPFGHRWSGATHTRDLSHDEMVQAMARMGGQ